MSYSPPSVFVADDDEDDQYLLRLCFTEHIPTCQLHFSSNGNELLFDLSQQSVKPQLVVLDLNMPFMGGFEVLEILRNDPQYATTPIIIMTTSSSVDDKIKALSLGATRFVTKPLNQEALGKIVVELFNDWLGGTSNEC